MAIATLLGLRARMTPPAASRLGERRGARAAGDGAAEAGGAEGGMLRRPEVDRVLHLATGLFGVATASLVLAGLDGLAVAASQGTAGQDDATGDARGDAAAPPADSAADAVAAACRLFEVLAAAEPPESGPPTGVMEEVAPGSGFVAATPILSAAGRCLGAVVLRDGGRRALLTGLQRRLFAEFGDLLLPALGAGPASRDCDAGVDAQLQALADAEPDAFALFDPEGRCLLRSARFDALVGRADPSASVAGDAPAGGRPELAGARGCGASWIALRLARDVAPVGVYRAALADGTWLSVEERRGPLGRSLLARVERPDAFGGDGEGDGDLAHLFERCPAPMFVFDRDTRAVLAVNAAALALYGWDRDAFLGLGLDGIGPVEPADPAAASAGWTHRTRDGRPLPVSGRTVDLAHRGRPAVLVTVDSALGTAERAA